MGSPDAWKLGVAYGFARALEATGRALATELEQYKEDPAKVNLVRIKHLLADGVVELGMVRDEVVEAFGGGSG